MKLTVENGTFAYPHTQTPVLQQVNFTAESGQVLAILGPNGAGKTTLLRCLMGLLRWDSGRTLLDGQDIRQMSERALWQQIAYVPQARDAATTQTVEQTVLLGRSARVGVFSLPKKEDLQAADEALEMLGLTALRQKKCCELSGGQLQMVLIARAMAAQPRVLILDEPESNLDFRNQMLVLDTISNLAHQGVLCIFNTHYPAHALRRADRSLLLLPGGETRIGPTTEIVSRSQIEAAFGVQTVVGTIETPERIFRDIFPVGLADGEARTAEEEDRRAIAMLAILFPNRDCAGQINDLLHAYREQIVGRMGMPHPEADLYLISVTLDGPRSKILTLTDQLGRIPGVSVKATFAKEVQP